MGRKAIKSLCFCLYLLSTASFVFAMESPLPGQMEGESKEQKDIPVPLGAINVHGLAESAEDHKIFDFVTRILPKIYADHQAVGSRSEPFKKFLTQQLADLQQSYQPNQLPTLQMLSPFCLHDSLASMVTPLVTYFGERELILEHMMEKIPQDFDLKKGKQAFDCLMRQNGLYMEGFPILIALAATSEENSAFKRFALSIVQACHKTHYPFRTVFRKAWRWLCGCKRASPSSGALEYL